MQTIKLKIKDPQAFIDFLKKFSAIDTQLLLEFENGKIKAKNCTPEKSVIKSSYIDLNSVFEMNEQIESRIYVGIFKLDKLITSFSAFSWNSDTWFEIDYEEINEDKISSELRISTSDLIVNFPCASLKIFNFIISDDTIKNVTNLENEIYSFNIGKDIILRMNSLFKLDGSDKLLSFLKKKSGKIVAKTKSFTLDLDQLEKSDSDNKFSIDKKYWEMSDKENSLIHITSNQIIIIKSTETNTVTIIGEHSE